MKKIWLVALILFITSTAYAARIDIEDRKNADPENYSVGDSFKDVDTMTLELYSKDDSQDSSISTNAGNIATKADQADLDTTDTAVGLNTVKVGITTEQANAIIANTAKVTEADTGTNTGNQVGDGVTITGVGTAGDPFVAVGSSGSGDVVGPSSATDNAIPRYDTTTGKLLQDSSVAINDDGDLIPDASTQTIGDALNPFQDFYAVDENGAIVTARQLAGLQRDYAEESSLLPYSIACDVTAGVWTCTITDTSGQGYLAFALDDKVLRSAGNTLTATLTALAGTDASPNNVYVYVQNNGSNVPEIVGSNTSPEGVLIHAHVANYKAGSVSASSVKMYGKVDSTVQMQGIAKKVAYKAYSVGPVYQTGVAITATSTDITFGVGTYDMIFDAITTAEKQATVDGMFYVSNAGVYSTITDFSFGGEYSDGVAIGDGKSFNVVLGIMENGTTNIMGLVQSGTSEEYGDFKKAFEDKKNQTVYLPADTNLKLMFLPVARIIVDRTGSTYTLEQFDDGKYYQDLRGTRGGSGGGGASSSNVNDGNVASDIPSWNAISGEYDPKTVAETQNILDINTLSGNQEVTGDKTHTGATIFRKLRNLIFWDNTSPTTYFMTSETLSFTGHRALNIGDYDTRWAGEALIGTDGLLEDGIIEANKLEATNSPTDNYVPSYDSTTGGFTWENVTAGSFAFDTYPAYEDSAHTSGIARNSNTLAIYSTDASKWLTVALSDTLDPAPVTYSLTLAVVSDGTITINSTGYTSSGSPHTITGLSGTVNMTCAYGGSNDTLDWTGDTVLGTYPNHTIAMGAANKSATATFSETTTCIGWDSPSCSPSTVPTGNTPSAIATFLTLWTATEDGTASHIEAYIGSTWAPTGSWVVLYRDIAGTITLIGKGAFVGSVDSFTGEITLIAESGQTLNFSSSDDLYYGVAWYGVSTSEVGREDSGGTGLRYADPSAPASDANPDSTITVQTSIDRDNAFTMGYN